MKSFIFLLLLSFNTFTIANTYTKDSRVCGVPKRTEEGRIKRESKLLFEFKKLYHCPSTGRATGACPGWAIDHVIPLACGGCDSIENLQWMKNEIKSCSGDDCKDRWERKIYCK